MLGLIILLYVVSVIISFAIMFYCELKIGENKTPYDYADLIKFALIPILNVAVIVPAFLAGCEDEKKDDFKIF